MRPRPAIPHLVLVLAAAMLAAACGGAGDSGSGGDDVATTPAASEPVVEGEDAAAVARPVSRARANAIGRRLDALVAAYAPVTARVNFLVSAETLREDAEGSGSGEVVELERTGAVRVELRRMRAVLESARPKVAASAVDGPAQQLVRRRMLAAIDSRARALGELEFALDGLAGEVGDTAVDQRFDAWDLSWNESLRAAREATTALQDERARVGLAPAPEEAIR